jgi:hypothetical protein
MATPSEEMIYAFFDAHHELEWVTKMEPKFKANLWEAEEIEELRDAWMALAEAREWNRWQEKVNGRSDADLQREIAECRAQIDTFRKGLTTDRDQLWRIMECKDDGQPVQQAAKDRGREM